MKKRSGNWHIPFQGCWWLWFSSKGGGKKVRFQQGRWCNFPNAALPRHLKRTFSPQETTFLGRPIFKGELPSFREAKSCEMPTPWSTCLCQQLEGFLPKTTPFIGWDRCIVDDEICLKLQIKNFLDPTMDPHFIWKKSWCWKKGCWWYTSLSSRKLPYKYTEFSLFLKGWRITTKTYKLLMGCLNEYHCLGLALQNPWKNQKKTPKWYHVACFIILGRCHRRTKNPPLRPGAWKSLTAQLHSEAFSQALMVEA